MTLIVLFLVGIFILLALLWGGIKLTRKVFRRSYLRREYENEEFVQTILSGRIAQGMTREMVEEAWGEPADFDERVMKTKTKQEMKYDQTGKNRFGTRVYLEDGLVVGWETK